jgi:hypothetical protein
MFAAVKMIDDGCMDDFTEFCCVGYFATGFAVWVTLPQVLLCGLLCHRFCCVGYFATGFAVWVTLPQVLLCG